MVCPNCGQGARFLGWRTRNILSLMGPIAVGAAYYHCRHCRCGHKPWEQALRLKPITLTPAAEQITAMACLPVGMAGVLGSFGQGAERVLQKMACLPVGMACLSADRAAARCEPGWRRWT